MGYKKRSILLAIVSLILVALYIFYYLTGNISYILPKIIIKVVAIIITGGAIAFSTTIFMTITNNRILTPSIMGLDSLYMLTQTFIIFIFGSRSLIMMYGNINYLLLVGIDRKSV